jgi:hypothetical protein
LAQLAQALYFRQGATDLAFRLFAQPRRILAGLGDDEVGFAPCRLLHLFSDAFSDDDGVF